MAMKRTLPLLLAIAWLLAAGCAESRWTWGRNDDDCLKPTIAVMKFENRAAFPLQWDLGDGMKDVLVDRLFATGRYHVVERPELDSVLREIRFQQAGATRAQGRAEVGRLKNVQYLIKGTVTDFGHVATNRGFLGISEFGLFGGSQRAVLGMTVYVVDVESGEIIASESLSESVRASDLAVTAAYKGVSFGGSTFYRTPLGKATSKVIDKAVRRVTDSIAARPWQAKVAMVQPHGAVVLNGGRDRGVRPGAAYDVLECGRPITDPETGDCLGHCPGTRVGRVAVSRVHDRYSEAKIVAGTVDRFEAGQTCRLVDAGR